MIMRKFLFFVCCSFVTTVLAQDVIVKKDGTTIMAEVLSKENQKVEFRKWNSSDSTIYSFDFRDLLSIN